MRKDQDQYVARARQLLDAGYLLSMLPEKIIEEFGLTPAQARRVVASAAAAKKKVIRSISSVCLF